MHAESMEIAISPDLKDERDDRLSLSLTEKIVFAALYIAASVGVIYPNYQGITLPAVSACMIVLSFWGKSLFIFPAAIFYNDALGSIPGGFTVFFIFFACFIIDVVRSFLFYRKSTNKDNTFAISAFIVLSILTNYQLLACSDTSVQRFFISSFLLIWALFTLKKIKDREDLETFLKIVSSTIVLSVIISSLSGQENQYGGAYGDRITRGGLIGTGSAIDPNLGGMIIDTGLIVCLMCNLKNWIKFVFIFILLYGILRTVSLTGISLFIFSLLLYQVITWKGSSRKRKAGILFGAIVSIAFLSTAYGLIESFSGDTEHALKDRIIEKTSRIAKGDTENLDSSRSTLRKYALEYILDQDITGQLIGGNSVFVLERDGNGYATHNTYLDILLRFGFLGFIVIFSIILFQLINIHKHNYTKFGSSRTILAGFIALKILYLIYSFTVSINTGLFLTLWTSILILL